jgi:hypothetical protein
MSIINYIFEGLDYNLWDEIKNGKFNLEINSGVNPIKMFVLNITEFLCGAFDIH